ncbi:MAG: NADH-quinone oxidoreductase subunit NuoH [Planctomycetota bacterium]
MLEGALESLGLGGILPGWTLVAVSLAAVAAAALAFVCLFALAAVWAERKVSAHMQCRLGPMEVGPHGILQTIADALKLLAKEDIVPRLADRPLYAIAPALVFAGAFARFVPIPFGRGAVASDLDLGLFYLASIGAVEVVGVIMAGWSSNNKWSLFGAMRAATQLVSYEIPIGLAFLAVVAAAGSFSLLDIVEEQRGWIWDWFAFRNPFLLVLFVAYAIASLAECRRSPFDLPEAESELVSGFHTEYSGMRFALFFLAEYAAMYLVSAVAATIFLGGWWTGIPPLDSIGLADGSGSFAAAVGFGLKSAVFVSKALFLVFVQMWVRWTVPRVRLDQMMALSWKVLTPVGLFALVGSVFWELL